MDHHHNHRRNNSVRHYRRRSGDRALHPASQQAVGLVVQEQWARNEKSRICRGRSTPRSTSGEGAKGLKSCQRSHNDFLSKRARLREC